MAQRSKSITGNAKVGCEEKGSASVTIPVVRLFAIVLNMVS
jgi:hypothetical protein